MNSIRNRKILTSLHFLYTKKKREINAGFSAKFLFIILFLPTRKQTGENLILWQNWKARLKKYSKGDTTKEKKARRI